MADRVYDRDSTLESPESGPIVKVAGQTSVFQDFSISDKSLQESGMLKRAAALFFVCASIAVGMSCSTSSSRYLYAAIPTSNEIAVYREDPNSGGLIQIVGSPLTVGPAVQSLAMHPSGKYLYAANSGQNTVSFFDIEGGGSLTENPPRQNTGSSPTLLAIDSAGAYLYVANSGSFDISVFSIGSTGLLTAIPQCTSSGNCSATAPIGMSAINMAVAPSGNVLYVTGPGIGSQGAIQAFPLTKGVLGTPITGSPYTTGSGPYGLAIAPGGGFLYTANKLDNSISEFTINSDGSLTQMANSPIGETYTSPVAALIDKSGSYLYVANQGNGNLTGYSIGSDGSLTLLSTSPFITATEPTALAGDPGGGYLFVGNQASSPSIQSFSLAQSTGTLTSVATYGITGTGATSSMVLTP
jgi:6-phosphogluconolactonase